MSNLVTVPANSRYKDTFGYIESVGKVLGPFRAPYEMDYPQDSWQTHVIVEHEVGFPDIIAARYFGAGGESYWWAVCLVNGIVDPDIDMVPGMRIRIPSRNVISTFAARAPV